MAKEKKVPERNARFWVWWNYGPTKLTLRPGESLTVRRSSPTDEGFSSETMVWSFDGEVITREWSIWGRDCDGSIGDAGDDYCPIEDIPEGENLPSWKMVSREHWDPQAEAMGY